MKAIRDIFHENGLNYSQVVGEKNTIISMGLDSFNQALKEIEEVILNSLPDNKEPAISAFKAVPKSQILEARNNTIYNQALEDTRKAIKSMIGGKDV